MIEEKYYSIQIKGQAKPFLAQNLDRTTVGWIKFERVNTASGKILQMEVNSSEVVSITESEYVKAL